MGELIPADVLHALSPASVATLTGNTFFPGLMSEPFKHGLIFAFSFSAILYLIAARSDMARRCGSERSHTCEAKADSARKRMNEQTRFRVWYRIQVNCRKNIATGVLHPGVDFFNCGPGARSQQQIHQEIASRCEEQHIADIFGSSIFSTPKALGGGWREYSGLAANVAETHS